MKGTFQLSFPQPRNYRPTCVIKVFKCVTHFGVAVSSAVTPRSAALGTIASNKSARRRFGVTNDECTI